MEDFKQRVRDEYRILTANLMKLDSFMQTSDFKHLSIRNRSEIETQSIELSAYLDTLRHHLVSWGDSIRIEPRGLPKTPEQMATTGWDFGAFDRIDGSCISTHNGDADSDYDAIAFAVEYSTDCRIVDLRKLPEHPNYKEPKA